MNVVSKELDNIILQSMAKLAPYIGVNEFTLFLKFLKLTENAAIKQNNEALFNCLIRSKITLSAVLLEKSFNTDHYKLYLHDLLGEYHLKWRC